MSAKTTNVNQSHETSHKQSTPKPMAKEPAALTQPVTPESSQRAMADLGQARPADILALQRTVGNRAVSRLIQTKLTVGPAGNHYEQEADRVATQVMAMSAPAHTPQNLQRAEEEDEEVQMKPLAASITPLVQRHTDGEEVQTKLIVQRAEEEDEELQAKLAVQRAPEEEEEVQMKSLVQREAMPEEEEELQAKPEVQRASAGAGFEVSGDFEHQLSASHGGGNPLPAAVREFMEPRFEADFGDVRVHTGDQSAQLNRSVSAQAFTLGQDIYLGAGKNDLESDQGKQLLAHELTHVVQQTGSAHRTAAHIQKSPAAVIQRHSSWEHKALGDITPESLAVLGSYQEMTEAYKNAKQQAGLLGKVDPANVQVPIDFGGQVRQLSVADFLHVMGQEIGRLKTFRDHPPTEASAQAENRLRDLAEMREARKSLEGEFGQHQFRQKTKDQYQLAMQNKLQEIRGGERWQVRLLAIKHNDGQQTVITYGEMNTLGDFVGDPAQLQEMSQDNLQQIINGIRQQALIRFMRMRDTVKGNWNRNKNYWGQGFSNTAGATGRGVLADINIGSDRFGKLGSEGQGQLRLMLADKVKVGDTAETDYTSGLARNACHFAPESWITWEKYHRAAVDLARSSVQLRINAVHAMVTGNTVRQNALNKEAEDDKQQAIIQNGFSDHFLQDSYAAGHLINKDEIMKWYTLWQANDSTWNQKLAEDAQDEILGGADKNTAFTGGVDVQNESGVGSARRWDYMTDKTSKKRVAMAKQPGLGVDANRYSIGNVGPGQQGKNMQAVENMTGTWQERFTALGLQVPPSLTEGTAANMVFKEWQKRVAEDKKYVKVTAGEFAELTGLGANLVQNAFTQFVTDVVAHEVGKRGVLSRGDTIYELRKTFQLTGTSTVGDKLKGKVTNPTDVTAPDYGERAKKAVYKDYHEYMNTAHLQAATNILHDHFCEQGLYVKAANGDLIGKVYGDDALFKAESSKGARYAGTTSNMSRDAIYEMAGADPARGVPPEPQGKTTANILGRFPTKVTAPDGGSEMSLADWHTNGPLKLLCDRVIFPQANRNFWKTFVGGGKAALTTGLSEKISKDVSVHEGALF